MESASVETFAQADETIDHAARGVGRAIAFEVGYSHAIDERALQTARGYATMAGDSLGKDVRSCLRFGNTAAAAFDALIFEFAIVAVVTTFRCWAHFEYPRMQQVEADRRSGVDRRRSLRQIRWAPRTDRRVWKGRLG